jgi:ABC-type sugar transport system permease subunit
VVAFSVVAAPAYFFARMETARAFETSHEWRGLAAARLARERVATESEPGLASAIRAVRGEAQPGRGIAAAHLAAEGGIDEYGIKRSARTVTVGPDGKPAARDDDLDARFRELGGRIASGGEEAGACAAASGRPTVCGVPDGAGGTVAIAFVPDRLDTSVAVASAALVALLFAAAAFALARLARGWQPWAAMGLPGLVGGGALAWVLADRASSMVADLAGTESSLASIAGAAAPALPSHATAFGAGFVAAVAIASAAACAGLARPLSRLVSDLRGRPFIYAAIAPAMVGMVLLIFVPFFMGVYLAFLDNNGRFVGLANFGEILLPSGTSDTSFYFTLGVTVMWTALNVALHVAIGLALALVLSDAKLRGKAIYRVLLIVPWAVPNYITALIWKWIFNTQYGPANALLAMLGMGQVDWLGRSFWTNFGANLATNTWLGFPFMMIVSLGALQSIPADLYEAAQMDGAGRWQRFRHVTLPLLKPALFPAIILGTIWTFNMFNVVYLVSGGAPDNKTNILITEAYRAFRVLKNYGLAAAYSLIIFCILAAYTAVTNRITKAAESVYE